MNASLNLADWIKRRGRGVLGGLLLLFATGCRVLQNTAELPGKTVDLVTQAGTPRPDPGEIQQTLLRSANEFSTGMILAVDKLRRHGSPLEPGELLQWKLAFDAETCAIASGPNAAAGLLDLTFFVTVSREVIEEYWQPRVFAESAESLLATCRSVEADLWFAIGKWLTTTQQAEFRRAIQNWRKAHPEPESVLAARAVGFASRWVFTSPTDLGSAGNILTLLLLDPFAGMDPAVREIAQTRFFAERALYVTQKMPRLMRWQTELLSLNTVRLPAVQQVVSNSTQLTLAADSFARVADQLPQLVNDQREAAIQQIFAGLARERTNLVASLAADEMKLRPALGELRQTLIAGTSLTESADELVQSLDAFMARFDQAADAPVATATNSRPFDILDYATTAREVTTTIKELNATIHSLDHALPQIQQASEMFERAGNRLLFRLFLAGAGLIALAIFLWAIAGMLKRR
jgi:hypothetical protein